MKQIKTSRKGRKCRFPNCKQILSIYNHAYYCHVHIRFADKMESLKELKYYDS